MSRPSPQASRVTQRQVVSRGLASCCPNCGAHSLFAPGLSFRINEQCSACGLKFNRGEGFFLGPLVINYTLTVAIYIVPVMLLGLSGKLSALATIIAIAVGTVVIPVLLYRRSWGWWLLGYFYFLPQKLPNNHDESHEDEEE